MAVKKCNSESCCRDTNYKICKDISCGDGEESQHCRIPNNCKAVDCFCVLHERNCIGNEDGSLGVESDEGKNYIFVENGCHGLFRVCYKKEIQCPGNSTISTKKPIIFKFTTPAHVTKKTVSRRTTTIIPQSTSYSPNTSREGHSSNTGLLLGLPLALVAVVMVTIIIFYIQYKRRKQGKTTKRDDTKSKRDFTYTSNITVDDEVVYDVIRDNHINTILGNSSPVYNSGLSNMTGQDQTRVPTQANGDYFLSSNDGFIGANGGMTYYIKPSGTHYFVLEKDDGIYEQLSKPQKDTVNKNSLRTDPQKVEQDQPEEKNSNEYFVLEEERKTTQ